jgi:hypothetical protein
MCSILCRILFIWEALGWKFFILAWFMNCQQGGEVWAWNGLLDAFRRFSGGFEPFMGFRVHQSDRSRSLVWPVRVLALFICKAGLTCGGDRSDQSELSCYSFSVFFKWFACISSGGSMHLCRGSSLWFFELWFGGLRSLLELCSVSDVSSRCPCLRGSRLVFFKWSCSLPLFGFRSLVGVSFCSFLFFFLFLLILYVGVVNALINGEIEDHVWFEARWMVASLCDEWPIILWMIQKNFTGWGDAKHIKLKSWIL